MPIFLAHCPRHLHRVLLLFGLQLLENMLGVGGRGWGPLFPSTSSLFLRASCSLAPDSGSPPNPSALSGKKHGAVEFWTN